MKIKVVISLLIVVLICGGLAASASALSKSRAEQAVVQRVKAKYFPRQGAFAECNRLSGTLFGCTYNYTSFSKSWCEGGAKVRQFPSGISVSLGRPRAVIDNGGC